MPLSAWLLIQGVSPESWACQIDSQRQTIGRSVHCDICVPDETISRKHAEIWCDDGSLFVRDLNSLNGTFVDDEQVSDACFSCGSSLRLGRVQFVIVSQMDEECGAPGIDIDIDQTAGCAQTMEVTQAEQRACALLTPGQQQVLRYLLLGHSEKQVAAEMNISRQTVHSHVKEIYRLLDVHSRAELMAQFISPTSEMREA